jgi:hypothetical protein
VDDSTDETPAVIGKLQEWFPLPIKLIHRPQDARKNGLGGAVVEGFKASQGAWMGVMDADLQHPPEMIPQLLHKARQSGVDVVIGSRLAEGGDSSSLGFTRNIISHVFALTTRLAFPQRLWGVTDPLTGFFLTRRGALKVEELQPDGFKILLEILVSHPQLKVAEVPIQFGYRNAGESRAVPAADGGQCQLRQIPAGGVFGVAGQQPGVVCLHGMGGHPLCDLGGDCDAGVDVVDAGTDDHGLGGAAGAALPAGQPGVVICDDGVALLISGQMDLDEREERTHAINHRREESRHEHTDQPQSREFWVLVQHSRHHPGGFDV